MSIWLEIQAAFKKVFIVQGLKCILQGVECVLHKWPVFIVHGVHMVLYNVYSVSYIVFSAYFPSKSSIAKDHCNDFDLFFW